MYEDHGFAAARDSVGKLYIADANAVREISHASTRVIVLVAPEHDLMPRRRLPLFLAPGKADNLESRGSGGRARPWYDLLPEEEHAW